MVHSALLVDVRQDQLRHLLVVQKQQQIQLLLFHQLKDLKLVIMLNLLVMVAQLHLIKIDSQQILEL